MSWQLPPGCKLQQDEGDYKRWREVGVKLSVLPDVELYCCPGSGYSWQGGLAAEIPGC